MNRRTFFQRLGLGSLALPFLGLLGKGKPAGSYDGWHVKITTEPDRKCDSYTFKARLEKLWIPTSGSWGLYCITDNRIAHHILSFGRHRTFEIEIFSLNDQSLRLSGLAYLTNSIFIERGKQRHLLHQFGFYGSGPLVVSRQ